MFVSGEGRAVFLTGLSVVLTTLGTAWGGSPTEGVNRSFHIESEQDDGAVLTIDAAALARRWSMHLSNSRSDATWMSYGC